MMKSTIYEIKNSLEGINSRIAEAEEQISNLEEKIVDITTTEQNKEKRMKRTEEASGATLNAPTFESWGSQKKKRKKKCLRKYLKRL